MNTHFLVDTFLKGLLGQYEEKTGLKGIRNIGHGLLSEEVKRFIPNSPVHPTMMELGAKILEWSANFKTETPKAIPTPATEVKDETVGQTFPGYSEFRGRTGRMR